MVNPVQSSDDQSLTDDNDAASAVPTSAYATVPLRNLDGSGYLRGKWVTVESSTGTPAYAADGRYFYTRDQDQFEQVMGYFWVNQAQEYLQSLGFGSTLPGIINEPFSVKINQYGGDNSYQTDKPYRIRLGKGGVDDAEDAEVIVHEYGTRCTSRRSPGTAAASTPAPSASRSATTWRSTVGLAAAQQYGWPVAAEPGLPDGLGLHVVHRRAALHPSLRRQPAAADHRGQVHFRRPDLEPGALGDPARLRRARPRHRRPGTPR